MSVCNPSLNKKYFVKTIEYVIASSEHSQGEFFKDMPSLDTVEVFIPHTRIFRKNMQKYVRALNPT